MTYVAPELVDGLPAGASVFQPALDEIERLSTAAAAETTLVEHDGFTLTATTTSPTKGASTYTSTYVVYGALVSQQVRIVIGSGFSAGSGTYRFLLPVEADTTAACGGGWCLVNESGVALRVGGARLADATHAEIWLASVGGGAISESGPSGAGWTTGDWVEFGLTYVRVMT